MQIVNKKGVGDYLCKIFHPKCFKTTNFDRFRYGVSLRYVFKISCQILKYSDYAQRRLDSYSQSIMGNLHALCQLASFTRWPQRSKHLYNMGVFERRDYRAVILQENSTVELCLHDSFYDVAFTDPSILFWHCARGFCNCLRDRITFNILKFLVVLSFVQVVINKTINFLRWITRWGSICVFIIHILQFQFLC